MAKSPPTPTRYIVFSAEGNPIADVPFAQRDKTVAALPEGFYRGVSRNEIWILNEEEIRVPNIAAAKAEAELQRRAAAKSAREAEDQAARKRVEAKAEREDRNRRLAIEAIELERVRREASARAEREWKEEKREATERQRREEARRAEERQKRAEEATDEATDGERGHFKPAPIPSLPTKLPPAPAVEETKHPLVARLRFRSPIQSMIIESLLQEFLHDHASRIAEHGKIFDELRSSVDLLDQTLQSAALEEFLLKKRPLMPLDRRAQPSDVRAAAELCRLAIQVVPELQRPERAPAAQDAAPLSTRVPANTFIVEEAHRATTASTPTPAPTPPPAPTYVGVWMAFGSWKCNCDFENVIPRDRQSCRYCGYGRPDPKTFKAPVGTNLHEVAKDDGHSPDRKNGQYISSVLSANNVIPVISDAVQLKAPLLKAEAQSRPVLIVGGVEDPKQTAWLRRALGGTVLWKSIPKHAGSSSIDPVVKSVEHRKASAVIMLEELISHNVSTQVKNAAKTACVPYVYGGKAGRGRLEQAIQAIERYYESHQEAKKR